MLSMLPRSNRTFMELKLDTHIDALDVATF